MLVPLTMNVVDLHNIMIINQENVQEIVQEPNYCYCSYLTREVSMQPHFCIYNTALARTLKPKNGLHHIQINFLDNLLLDLPDNVATQLPILLFLAADV